MKAISRAALAAAAVGLVAVGGVVVAQATEPTSADEQLTLIEDFGYPDAARILAEDNVKLISGDGHILYTQCTPQPVNGIGSIVIHSSDPSVGKDGDGKVCFKVVGSSGSLVLQIPDVYEIRGDGHGSTPGHKGTAVVTSESGESKTVTLNPNSSQQVGVGVPGNGPETLVKLEIKP